jgi:peptidoglycan biosynthesis protein MviN/MurJ (putative lipid II flippase)
MIGHGGITADNVRLLWYIMLALIGLLIGGTAGQVTAVAFYAMGDTRTPTMLFVFTFTVYIPVKVLVFLHYGLLGLAIITSVHLIINFLLQLIILERITSRNQLAVA